MDASVPAVPAASSQGGTPGADEDFGERSLRRTIAIAALKDALQIETVPVAFWACLQVCDIEMLEDLVSQSRYAQKLAAKLFLPLIKSCHSLPRIWMQKPLKIPEESESSTSSDSPKKASQLESEALVRDDRCCVLTRKEPCQVARIYPQYLLKPKKQKTAREMSVPSIWEQLRVFWPEQQVDRWQRSVFQNPENPSHAIDGLPNMICLRNDLHQIWNEGRFALRPISLTPDKTTMHLEFHWLPKPRHGPNDEIDIMSTPLPSRGVTSVGRAECVVHDVETDAFELVGTGRVFKIHTHNPNDYPLPSIDFLEMAWFLTRIVSLSAAAEDKDLEYNDDDEDGMAVPISEENERRILEWIPAPPQTPRMPLGEPPIPAPRSASSSSGDY